MRHQSGRVSAGLRAHARPPYLATSATRASGGKVANAGPLRRAAMAAALVLAITTTTVAVTESPVSAAPGACSYTWAYRGGDRAYGGCKGSFGGTWFRVGQRCGRTLAVRYSPWTWAPNGVAVSAVTDNCKWYDGSGGSRAAWVEW